MKKAIVFCALILAFSTAAYCGQLSKIELTDGSVINGELVSYTNGVYTINAPNLGEVKVAGEKVSKIQTADSALPSTTISPLEQASYPNGSQVAAYQQTLMKNPENVAIVTGLIKTPSLQEMANDPDLQAAAKKGDIQALMKNPKFMEMVNSPEIQEAVQKLKK